MAVIAIVGAGAWGTALALHAARAGHQVTLWARDPKHVLTNPRLPGFALPPTVQLTAELPGEADAILMAVPTQHLAETLGRLSPNAPLLLCCKGLDARTGRLPLEIAAHQHPATPAAILTGPNFATEIAAGLPAAAVIASENQPLRQSLCALLGTQRFRLYGNADPVGAQLGGAAKNVIAIAAGVVMGAGLGENARAALITRGLAEITRLTTALGGHPETTAGLSGLGDLVLTCTGSSSRNFRYGHGLGQGLPLASLTDPNGPVIEGIKTAPALLTRAAGIDLPICTAVADLVGGVSTVREIIDRVLSRPARDEK